MGQQGQPGLHYKGVDVGRSKSGSVKAKAFWQHDLYAAVPGTAPGIL